MPQFAITTKYADHPITVSGEDLLEIHEAVARIDELQRDADVLRKKGAEHVILEFHRSEAGDGKEYPYYGFRDAMKFRTVTLGRTEGTVPFFPKGEAGYFEAKPQDGSGAPHPAEREQRPTTPVGEGSGGTKTEQYVSPLADTPNPFGTDKPASPVDRLKAKADEKGLTPQGWQAMLGSGNVKIVDELPTAQVEAAIQALDNVAFVQNNNAQGIVLYTRAQTQSKPDVERQPLVDTAIQFVQQKFASNPPLVDSTVAELTQIMSTPF